MSYLTSPLNPERYPLILRGSLMITAGSLIGILETFIAIYLGLYQVPYQQALIISFFVISITSVLILITRIKKKFLVWQEWVIFGSYFFFFQIGFCLWIYRLGDLRLLALINALTTISILLSYTNMVQSFLLSIGSLTSYFFVSWYSIKILGQPGSPEKEAFFSFCLIPSFLLISSSAYYINSNRKKLQKAKSDLEKLNFDLSDANDKLKKEQLLSKIDMSLAGEIQNAIFPKKAPLTTDWDIAFMTKPYSDVSGDFYDFYINENSLKGVSLFDVSGHGVAPALITILAKPVFYSHFKRCESMGLEEVLESAHSDLFKELEEVNLYITGLILRMDGNEVEYVNAGHPDLILLQSSEKKIFSVSNSSKSFKRHPIGISHPPDKYTPHRFNVLSGDFLIFYSDGLIDSKNDKGDNFGIARVSHAVESSQRTDAADLLKHLVNSLNDFTGDMKSADDITIIIARKI